jgi:hypothetical protein
MYGMPMQASPYAAAVAVPDPHGGMAITGLVLGIISVVAAILPLCGFPLTIAALVFSILGRKSHSRRTMATVGLALSLLAFVLTILSAAYGVYAASR